jgi:type II secretory pathway component PulF
MLTDRGLFPLSVKPRANRRLWGLRARPTRTLASAMQSLAVLTEIGVPLHHALEATSEVVDGPVRESLLRVRERVREGSSLATALAAQGDLFPAVAVGLVRAGERGVGLARGLHHAARQLERDADTRADLQAALAYPVVLLSVGSLAVGFIVLVVLPRFATLLTDVQGSLPAGIRVLLTASRFVREHGLATLAGSAVCLVVLANVIRKQWGRWAERLLEAPVIGAIRRGLTTARAARALGALLATGGPATAALAIAGDAAGDAAVARRLEHAQRLVAEGQALGDALEASRAVTAATVQLVRVGERAGRLADLLEQAATLEERAAARRVHALVTALEPLLIVMFAAVVAFIAGALLQALYSVRPGGL